MGRRARRRGAQPMSPSTARSAKTPCAGSISQRYGKFDPQTSDFPELFSSALYLSAPTAPFTHMAVFFRHRLMRHSTEGFDLWKSAIGGIKSFWDRSGFGRAAAPMLAGRLRRLPTEWSTNSPV